MKNIYRHSLSYIKLQKFVISYCSGTTVISTGTSCLKYFLLINALLLFDYKKGLRAVYYVSTIFQNAFNSWSIIFLNSFIYYTELSFISFTISGVTHMQTLSAISHTATEDHGHIEISPATTLIKCVHSIL